MKLSPFSFCKDIATLANLMLSLKGTPNMPVTSTIKLSVTVQVTDGASPRRRGMDSGPSGSYAVYLFSPFSSSFSVFFLNLFHHDASSRFDCGETVFKGAGGGTPPRWRGWTMGCGDVAVPATPVAMARLQAQTRFLTAMRGGRGE